MRRSLHPLALAYHGVATVPLRQDTASLFVRPDSLRRHIRQVRRWGYELVSFGELARRAGEGGAEGACALTFDDGFSDNLDRLVPVLEEEGATATVFVVSSWLGEQHPDAPWARILTADEVRRLAASPIEIGSHSHTHRDLTSIGPAAVTEDFRTSKDVLEDILQQPVTVAAYPYGYADAATGAACAEAGFTAACRNSGMGSWSDPMHLPREDVHNFSGRIGFHLKGLGLYERTMTHRAPRLVRSVTRRLRSAAQFRMPTAGADATGRPDRRRSSL